MNFSTFMFLRKYFNLPRSKGLRWGIVEEISYPENVEKREYRLCVLILGTNKYIDIAQRRMFSQVKCGLIKRVAMPAKRLSVGKEYAYTAENGWFIRLPKTFIADIYGSSWWQKEKTERECLM